MSTSWPPWPVRSVKQALDPLAESVRQRPDSRTDDEQAWLTRFLVVRTCGYLEQATHETSRGYVMGKSGGLVRAFAMSWLTRSPNPSPDNLVQLVGRFDQNWLVEFQDLLGRDDQRLYREISFLVDRRHKIAHGLNEGITPTKALSLKNDADTVVDWFIRRFDPNRRTGATGHT